jgi:hypothetical protein
MLESFVLQLLSFWVISCLFGYYFFLEARLDD